jgi:hypothetical protein
MDRAGTGKTKLASDRTIETIETMKLIGNGIGSNTSLP